uniref:Uncharacterized protein n=1 Tax=Leptobrachium leishanense TaxID=445787 RepID=A0A8C5LVP6_9ANUR
MRGSYMLSTVTRQEVICVPFHRKPWLSRFVRFLVDFRTFTGGLLLLFGTTIPSPVSKACAQMAPPKAQRVPDPPKSARKERNKKAQDSGSPQHALAHDPDASPSALPDLSDSLPPSESRLHAMLQDLRSTIQADIRGALQELSRDVLDLGERTDALETKADDLCLAHNDLVDRHLALQAAHDSLALKVADVEDRSRRNNFRIRGIAEAVTLADLHPYLLELFQVLLPEAAPQDLLLDRAHRLPRAKNLPTSVARDVIIRVHFFHIKEALMSASRKSMPLSAPYADISFFADLSASTMSKRREFSSLTKLLRNHKLAYRWGFPTKLLIWQDGILHVVPDVATGLQFLKDWNILVDFSPPREPSTSPIKVSPEWHRVRPK